MGGDPLAYLTAQLEAWRKAGTYQRLRVLESASASESRFDGHEVINLASNNYLGLTTHPKLVEAALEATRKAMSGGTVEEISKATDTLTQASHKLAEAMYKSQAGSPGGDDTRGTPGGDGAGPGAGAEKPKDNVVDAEFVDVEDKK